MPIDVSQKASTIGLWLLTRGGFLQMEFPISLVTHCQSNMLLSCLTKNTTWIIKCHEKRPTTLRLQALLKTVGRMGEQMSSACALASVKWPFPEKIIHAPNCVQEEPWQLPKDILHSTEQEVSRQMPNRTGKVPTGTGSVWTNCLPQLTMCTVKKQKPKPNNKHSRKFEI